MLDPKNSKSIISNKAYSFALKVIEAYKNLVQEKREFIISKQFLRSGTSIGANINEALSSESKRDFVHKLSISLKEGRETIYWLNLLHDTGYLQVNQYEVLNNLCAEILKMLTSIIKTTKEKYFPQNSKL
ncbi:four helix bundle protein [Ferruginibacter sp. SUN106]|uniref:four helix bundle protein n=1 Tax=Ferruginibacter sp. SUN106 TaxID=2978348 RepID=UPI003D364958